MNSDRVCVVGNGPSATNHARGIDRYPLVDRVILQYITMIKVSGHLG